MVDRRGWMTADEFTREWALCQVAPGINLLAITILIGRRLAGGPGIVVALVGLLLPSVTITILMTAFYARVRHAPGVQAALQGIIPATVGLGLVTSWDMALPLVQASGQEGKGMLVLSLLLLAGAGLAVARWHLPVVLVLCAAGAVGALAQWARQRALQGDARP